MARERLRQGIAVLLATAMPALPQQISIEPVRPEGSVFLRPYRPAEVPSIRTQDSARLHQLIRAGNLYLTVQDAIALVLENNLDLEVSRYNPILSEWRLERAQAGGALPGVPSAASQAGSVAAGQGVTGSQQSAGVSSPGNAARSGSGANAQISQIGPVTQNLDPVFQESTSFSHTTTPQANTTQSLTTALVDNIRNHTGSLQVGTLSGGVFTASFSDHYLNENSPSNLLNPSVAQNLSLSGQHNLLRGFGIAVNARQITIARTNLKITDLNFRSQVINLVSQTLNAYYNLSASAEDLRARRTAEDVASQFLQNIQEQIQVGTVAPTEEITSRKQVVNTRQARIVSETTLAQQELRLKNLISRQGLNDPLLAAAHIVCLDRINIPAQDDLPKVEDLVKEALASRIDLQVEGVNQEIRELSALGTKNGLLPSAQVFASTTNAGIAGRPRAASGPNAFRPDEYFDGGTGTALAQVFRRNFPSQRVGAFFATSLGNNTAQADYAIDQLSNNQALLTARKNQNQVIVDVMNNLVAVQQARARYEAAVENHKLQEELYRGEETRFRLGTSTPFSMTQAQRDVITAQASITSALVSYSTARISLDRVVGRILESNHIDMPQVLQGEISRSSKLE